MKISEWLVEEYTSYIEPMWCHKELHDNLWNLSELNLEDKEEVEL